MARETWARLPEAAGVNAPEIDEVDEGDECDKSTDHQQGGCRQQPGRQGFARLALKPAHAGCKSGPAGKRGERNP